jgi:ABC-type multidrug transport system ATPase subunit
LETGQGISVEERKRLTIGLELVAKPHLLFLDGTFIGEQEDGRTRSWGLLGTYRRQGRKEDKEEQAGQVGS